MGCSESIRNKFGADRDLRSRIVLIEAIADRTDRGSIAVWMFESIADRTDRGSVMMSCGLSQIVLFLAGTS
jgi:hypothetical protein